MLQFDEFSNHCGEDWGIDGGCFTYDEHFCLRGFSTV